MTADTFVTATHEKDELAEDVNFSGFVCKRCGDVQWFSLPISVQLFSAAGKVFDEQHQHCQPKQKEAGA